MLVAESAINKPKPEMMSKFGLLLIGVALGVVIALATWGVLAQDYTYQGSLIDPPAPAADFVLSDHNENPFRLSDQRGKVVLIFFGYTNCPDVCPVTLSEYKQIKAQLGDQAADVRFVFITVDPERDNTERLRAYLANFDPDFIGLTSDRATLESVWLNYGVYQARQDVGSAAGYLVDHTARVYAIDIQGNWRLTYPFGMETEKLAQDVLHLLQEK